MASLAGLSWVKCYSLTCHNFTCFPYCLTFLAQVRAFEQMWSAQALTLDAASAQPKYDSSSRAMQYLKVGAAAVGGGALLAVTGGLAAPAIAAGLGAAVTLAHGGSGLQLLWRGPCLATFWLGEVVAAGVGSCWW